MKENWFTIIFNNLYSKLWDLLAPTKFGTSRDNIEFKATQVVDILLQYSFLVDLTLILLESYKEEKGIVKPQPEA
jgi:hypothetical protein